jgi:hypothetical protein
MELNQGRWALPTLPTPFQHPDVLLSTKNRYMLGTFQQSHLRLEVDASEETLRRSLTQPAEMQKWMKFQTLPSGLPDTLTPGLQFTSWLGSVISIQHTVELVEPQRIRLTLSQGIDGFHEWAWGNGWVQSRIEGISLFPIQLGQTASLLLLKQFLQTAHR